MRAISRPALSLVFVFALLAGGTAAVRGQSALDGFDPNANGNIYAFVVQPDGKILIGGDFTTLAPRGGAPIPINHIARLNPDGTLDTNFNPNASDQVHAIVLQADGKILAGGGFTNIGGATRNRIARLNPDGTLDTNFNPNANNFVGSIALQADGKILAGGFFTGIGGQTRNYIARLDAVTGLADSFNPNANDDVRSLLVQADGKILVGGVFTSIGGQSRSCIARLDPTTGLADSFNPNATAGNNNFVLAMAFQADGKILVGGQFSMIGGQMRNNIARLDPASGLADSFDPHADFIVNAIVVQADGKILTSGFFTGIGGATRNYIARLDPTTGLADLFNPNADRPVYSIGVQADGKILVGGIFSALAPNGGATVTRNSIARVEVDGRLDQTLSVNIGISFFGFVNATAVQPDGKILIGGFFSAVNNVPRNNIARLNADGTLDSVFNPNVNSSNGFVNSIVVQTDGKILVGGVFTNIGGATRNRIARLDPTTGAADLFDPNASDTVNSIVVQADGKILVSGAFTSIGGATRNRIARLDPSTGMADSFDPNANDYVAPIAVQADGKILVGGGFTNIGGATRNRIARLDAASGMADSFDPNANGPIHAIAVQADGKILAGGVFNGANSIGGATRNRMARLDATKGAADLFDPNATGIVYSIALQADGKILTSGDFDNIGGSPRDRIARLDPTGLADSFGPNTGGVIYAVALQADGKILAGGELRGQPGVYFARFSHGTAALQNLAVTQNIITWTRGGSSPRFARVTFEYSTDNVNYTPLGNGGAAGNNWTLTGVNLPTGQNFYIRARGFYRGGYLTGSGSITESVRNAFLKPLRISAVARSSNDFVVTFDAVIGSTYRLERKLSLADANWQSIPGVSDLTATATVAQFTDPNALSLSKAFYRVRLLP